MFERLDRSLKRRFVLMLGTLLALLAMAMLWGFTPLRDLVPPRDVVHWVRQAGAVLGPGLAVAAFALAATLALPLTFLSIIAVLAFDPWQAYFCCVTGAAISATISYGLGAYLGRNAIRKLAPASVNAFSERLGGRGLATVVLLRFLPVAPFAIVNMLIGTTHIKLRDLLLGTFLGMTPGLLVMIFFVDTAASHIGL